MHSVYFLKFDLALMKALAGRLALDVSVDQIEQLSFAEFCDAQTQADPQRHVVTAPHDSTPDRPTDLVFMVDELDDKDVKAVYAAVDSFDGCQLEASLASDSIALSSRTNVVVYDLSAAQRLDVARLSAEHDVSPWVCPSRIAMVDNDMFRDVLGWVREADDMAEETLSLATVAQDDIRSLDVVVFSPSRNQVYPFVWTHNTGHARVLPAIQPVILWGFPTSRLADLEALVPEHARQDFGRQIVLNDIAQDLEYLLDSERDLPPEALDAARYVGAQNFDTVVKRPPVASTSPVVLAVRQPNALTLGVLAECANYAPGQRSSFVHWVGTLTSYDQTRESSSVASYHELRGTEVVDAPLDESDDWFVVELVSSDEIDSLLNDIEMLSVK